MVACCSRGCRQRRSPNDRKTFDNFSPRTVHPCSGSGDRRKSPPVFGVYAHVDLHDQTAVIESLPGPPAAKEENDGEGRWRLTGERR